MVDNNIDILLLQEINTNIMNYQFKRELHNIHRQYPHAQSVWSQIPFSNSNVYQPGGVAIIVRFPLSKHISHRIKDPMGRWSGVTLNIRGNPPLTVISTYQPTKDQSIHGTTNVTTQQTRWLQDHQLSTSVSQTYRQDLGALIYQLLQESHEIIIGGDFNEHTSVNNVLQDLVNIYKLVDIVSMIQPTAQSTYKRGNHVLDRIFVTRRISHQTQIALVDARNPIIATDHHPIKLQIDSVHKEKSEFHSRLLISTHRRKVTKYIREVYRRMANSNLLKDIESLVNKTATAKTLNQLDEKFTTVRLQSEKKLKSQHSDWWHIDLIEWKHKLEACNRTLRRLKRQPIRQEETRIRTLIEKQRYISLFRQHTQSSFQRRQTMLKEEIKTLGAEKPKNTKKINYLKHLIRTETIREVYRKLKYKTEPKQHNNTYLQVPEGNNTYRTITNTEEIAQHIATFNMRHFAQAEYTPFAKFRYLTTLEDTTPHTSNAIWSEKLYLHNAHLIEKVPKNTRHLAEKFLQNISSPPHKIVEDIITLEDWTRKIKKWKERTTTSPSGLHLGHYKALLAPHILSYDNDSAEKAELEHQQAAVLQAYMTLLNSSIQVAIPFQRWKTAHSIVLFKDDDNRYVNRIRNIHIYEADYNLILKLKWEQAIALSKKNNILHSSQYGSRQQRSSIDPVFLEIILQEVSRFTKTPFLQINYDAQACYDRIIPDIAFALSRKNGVHHKIIQMVRETMQSSKYFIKLGSHVTLQSYGNQDTTQLYGTGQGSGCSPHIWTMLSSELFNLYTENSQGFRLIDPYNSQHTSVHVTAYVDDVNTHHSFQENSTIDQMIVTASQAAQTWGNILHLSGGKLSPNKCNYYAVLWKYARTGRAHTHSTIYPPITIDDSEGSKIIINNVSTKSHHKSLGYLQSMENPIDIQKRWLQQKYESTMSTLNSASLDYKETAIFYRTIHTPRIQYISHVSSISQPDHNKITKQNIIQILQRMSFSSSTPKGVKSGHRSFGGLEMVDTYILQGAQNTINFIKHMSFTSTLRNPLWLAYKWWRFQDGRSVCPLQIKTDTTKLTESVWFEEIRTFIHQHGLEIKMDTFNYPHLRQRDKFIMDLVQLQSYSQKIINNINQCRIYLGAITLSDIVTIDGNQIELSCFQHKEATPISGYQTYSQNYSPNKSLWHYWQTFLKTLTHQKSRRLLTPLGEWIVSHSQIRRQYGTYRDEAHIYTNKGGIFEKKNINNQICTQLAEIPDHVSPCIVTFAGIIPSSYTRRQLQTPPSQPPEKESVTPLPNNIIIATDASLHQDIASIAWVITDIKGHILRQKMHRLRETGISSFRAEATGVCSVLQHIREEEKHRDITWHLHCDNKALIHRLQKIQQGKLNLEWIDSDILQNISLNITGNGSFSHVKGHQKITEFSEIPAKLNAYVDKLANQAIKTDSIDIELPGSITISGNSNQLFSTPHIIHFCQMQISRRYWKEKTGTEVYNMIDWELYQDICTNQRKSIAVLKMVSGLTPTNSHLSKQNPQQSSQCPLCINFEEDIHHIMFCSENPNRLCLQSFTIPKKLKKYGDIQPITITLLQSLESRTAITELYPLEDQQSIGWERMIQGKMARSLHEYVMPSMKKIKTERKFLKDLCLLLMEYWKKAWIYRINKTTIARETSISREEERSTILKLEEIYQYKPHLSQSNQRYLLSNISEHLKHSKRQINTWMKLHYRSFNEDIQRQKRQEKNSLIEIRVGTPIPCEAFDENMT